jgi:exonuclease III
MADMLERRKLDILCLQETMWRGNKWKDLAGGHKLLYCGQTGRNRVAIVLVQVTRTIKVIEL